MEPFKHLKLYFNVESLLFLAYYNFFYNDINLNILLVLFFMSLDRGTFQAFKTIFWCWILVVLTYYNFFYKHINLNILLVFKKY
jgi:hypothetical protein